MDKAEQAVQNFLKGGCNCAQAVLTAWVEDFNLDKNTALSIATGFGAGMGRTQDVCGAVSGAIMVLGLKYGSREGDGREKIDSAYGIVRSYIEEFQKYKGTIKCLDLLSGCNLSTDEGKKYFRDHNLREQCRDYVRHSCNILDRLLKENN